MDYHAYGHSELVHLVQVLERALTDELIQMRKMRKKDAQGVVEALIMRNS